jgi:tryptophanyl-tRNA synthetase
MPKPPDFRQEVLTRLRRMEALIQQGFKNQERNAMAFIDDIEAAVASQATADSSIIALLETVAAALQASGVDPARAAAVIATLRNEQDRILAAVNAVPPVTP